MKNFTEQTQKVQDIIDKTGAEFYHVSFDEDEIFLQADKSEAEHLIKLLDMGFTCKQGFGNYI